MTFISNLNWEFHNGRIKLYIINQKSNNTQKIFWNPYLNKLSAALINGLQIFPFKNSSKILFFDEFSKKSYIHLRELVDSSQIIFYDNFKQINKMQEKNELFDIVYVDLADNISSKISNFEKLLKNNGFLFLVFNNVEKKFTSEEEFSNWWNIKNDFEKQKFFEKMGIPLNASDMVFMLSSKYENFSTRWRDNIRLNYSKDTLLISSLINTIVTSQSYYLEFIEEVNLLNFFDSTLLIFQKNYENPS
tara:strand:- start:1236 stop:1976 length:741 start_codon:yes stop_codon:yes gene_type:complete